MDDARVLEGFKCVFSYLRCDKCNIPDDAILHIFVDVLKGTLKEIENIKRCGLIEFLTDVGGLAETLDAGIITVALEVAGWLGSDKERFEHFLSPLSQYLRTIWKKSNINDVSVRSALFNCLSNLTVHEKGVEWLVTANKDIYEEWLALLEKGSSIFLQKAVVQYVCRLCTSPYIEKFRYVVEHIVRSDILPVVRKYASAKQGNRKVCRSSFFLAILKLLEDVLESSLVCDIIASTDLVEKLETIVLLGNRSEAQAVVNVIKAFGINKKVAAEVTTERLIKQLCINGDILMAQSIAMIRIHPRDTSFSTKCQDVLLAPLKCVIGHLKDDTKIEEIVSQMNLLQQMSTKQQLTTVLCKTIANLISVNVVVPNIISSLLAATVSEVENDVNQDLKQYLQHNNKVQRSCLQYLCDFEAAIDNENLIVEIASSLVKIMTPSDVDPQTYSACVKCLSPLLPRLLATSHKIRNIPGEVALILQHQMCSIQWEQRDTTLEFLSEVVTMNQNSKTLMDWIELTRLHHHVWQGRQDGESYVRATAISCLYSFSTSSQLWSSLLGIIQLSEADVIKDVGAILESDTEAFTRRAAATFLFRFHNDKSDCLSVEVFQYIVKTVCARIHDFDWEVKLTVLNFIESLLNKKIVGPGITSYMPDYARCLQVSDDSSTLNTKQTMIVELRKCFDLGCLPALITALDDFDRKVVEKAVNVISKLNLKLLDLCEKGGMSKEDFLNKLGKACAECVDKVPSHTDCTLQDDIEVLTEGCGAKINTDLVKCISGILSFDEKSHNKKIEEDDYTRNPLSIIQDILSYGQKSEEDNVVDCY